MLLVRPGEGAPDGIEMAAEKVADGEVVAIPTDTVYGLACDALNEAAVRRIYEMKGREEDKPLVLFIGDVEQARQFAEIPEIAVGLMKRFWPGPVTFVCRARESVPAWIAPVGTVALRIPRHPVPLDLLKRTGIPLATTSANLSGQPPALTAAEVVAAFAEAIPLVVDGGPPALRKPSTVLDVTAPSPRILRRGAEEEQVRRAITDRSR